MSTSPSDGRGQTGEPSSPEQPTPSSTELVVASAGIDEQNGPTAEGIPMQVKGPKRRGSVEAGPQDDSPSKQITGGAPKPSPYGQQGTGPLSVMHPQTPRRQIWEAFTYVLRIPEQPRAARDGQPRTTMHMQRPRPLNRNGKRTRVHFLEPVHRQCACIDRHTDSTRAHAHKGKLCVKACHYLARDP